MTAAFEERLTAQRRQRLQTACMVARSRMNTKRKKQFDQISGVINGEEHQRFLASTPDVITMLDEDTLARLWKSECQAAGIGVGLLSWFFWNFFLPILIEIARDWIEANRTVTVSGTSFGESAGTMRVKYKDAGPMAPRTIEESPS